jgi:Flp pilus assembly pilin Flp
MQIDALIKGGNILKAFKQSNRGSIAVEAALIVPIVIIAVLVVIYIMLLIFQSCIMQITANNIAERVAAVYYSDKASFVTGRLSKDDIANLGIYRRWFSNTTLQQNEYKAATLKTLQQRSVLKGQSSLDIKQSGNIINRRITVLIRSDYDNPIGALTALWGLSDKISLRVSAEAAVDDPAEFIRNSDFIVESASKVPVISDFEDKWQEVVHKIIAYINKVTKEQGAADGKE